MVVLQKISIDFACKTLILMKEDKKIHNKFYSKRLFPYIRFYVGLLLMFHIPIYFITISDFEYECFFNVKSKREIDSNLFFSSNISHLLLRMQ